MIALVVGRLNACMFVVVVVVCYCLLLMILGLGVWEEFCLATSDIKRQCVNCPHSDGLYDGGCSHSAGT